MLVYLLFIIGTLCWDIFEVFSCTWLRYGLVSLGIFLEMLLLYGSCCSEYYEEDLVKYIVGALSLIYWHIL
jgi:hypothetical protein